MICIMPMRSAWKQQRDCQIDQKKLGIREEDINMNKYKDGIYDGDYGITYFVKDGKILLTHLGQTYRSSKHFVFGNWKQELQPIMDDQFDEIYNKVKQW